MQKILLKPHLTEKALKAASSSVFTFIVAKDASKHAVKAAVESSFKVHVRGVRTITIKGGTRRTGRLRKVVSNTPVRLARVQLKEGEKIALFESKKD